MNIIPQSALQADKLKAYLETVKAKLMAKPSGSGELVRDLSPSTDLGFATEVWDNTGTLSANDWTNDISHELDEDEEIVIIGVFNLTDDPQVTAVRFRLGSTGATTLAIFNLERLYAEEEVVAYFDEKDVIYYPKKQYVYIDYYSKSSVTAGLEKIGLIGFIRKPYGEEISKPISF